MYGGKGIVIGNAENVWEMCLAEWATVPPKQAKAECMAPVAAELDACLDKTAELFPECEPKQPPLPGPGGWQQQPTGVGAMQ